TIRQSQPTTRGRGIPHAGFRRPPQKRIQARQRVARRRRIHGPARFQLSGTLVRGEKMIARSRLILIGLLFLVVGCTDNIDSVTREYRAVNNEAIDALMMITTEAKAREMTIRVFKPLLKRYEGINNKLKIVKSNR